MARDEGPITVCVINLKGGVGKSTISTLLSEHAYTRRRCDVLAVDLDPQANLSQALMRNDYRTFLREQRPSIVEIFNGYAPPRAGRASVSALDADDVAETIFESEERSLQLIPSRFDFSDNLTDSLRPNPKVLAQFLSENFQHKDLIIIDCAPTESIFTTAAYHASGKILVPVKPEYFATVGFPLLHQSISNFKHKNRAHSLDVVGIVVNNAFYDGGNDGGPEKASAMGEIEEEAEKNGWPIFAHQIPFSRGFPKLMRGNRSHLGNADFFWQFSNEFFDELGL